jgi:uncharacterized surface anchored protein
MRDGAVAGFKYFAFDGAKEILIETDGNATGEMVVSQTKDFSAVNARIPVGSQMDGEPVSFTIEAGKHPLYFRFEGSGSLNFYSFELR